MRKIALLTLCLTMPFCLIKARQAEAAAPAKEITKLEIDESAKTFLRLPWQEREKRFESLEKESATSNARPPQDPETRRQLLGLLEAERRFMHSNAEVDSEEYPDYVANLMIVITKLRAREAYDALMDPVLLNWGYNAEALAAIGAPSVEPIIAAFRSTTDDTRKGNLFLAIKFMLAGPSTLPDDKRAEIRSLAMEQTENHDPVMREIAMDCLAHFTDAEAIARVKYLKDNDPTGGPAPRVYIVRMAAAHALKIQMETLARTHK